MANELEAAAAGTNLATALTDVFSPLAFRSDASGEDFKALGLFFAHLCGITDDNDVEFARGFAEALAEAIPGASVTTPPAATPAPSPPTGL